MSKRERSTLPPSVTRRQALGVLGAASAAVAVGCADTPTSPSTSTTTTTTSPTTSTNASCSVTPSETAGPYPSLTDMIRSDIREGLTGTQLTLTIKVVNANNACAPVSNAQVEIWHCDQGGNYSQYGSTTARTFYRGIQTTNSNGEVTFITNYPGWYQGRATHNTHRGDVERPLRQGLADCVSRIRQQRRPHERRLLGQRCQSDQQSLRRHLCRQPLCRTRHTKWERRRWIYSGVPADDCRLALREYRVQTVGPGGRDCHFQRRPPGQMHNGVAH